MNLNKYIEHTLLKQDATKAEITKLLDEAIQCNFLGVCVNPCNVKFAKEYLKDSTVKILETIDAIKNGADEIDMVINVGLLKDKEYAKIVDEISAIKAACQGHTLKVILETDLLTKDEIQKACELCIEAKADLVKTSTGFVKNGVGAKAEDVALMFNTVKQAGLQVKASGGIRDKEAALKMIEAGATRLGTSSGVKICE